MTKTQTIFERLNYVTDAKESGATFGDAFADSLKDISDVFVHYANSVGLSKEEVEDFGSFLPVNGDMFEAKELHGDLSQVKPYFDNQASQISYSYQEEQAMVR